MTLKSPLRSCLFFALIILVNSIVVAQGDGSASAEPSAAVKKGESTFKTFCSSCHKVKTDFTGPALQGAEQRWIDNADYNGTKGREWLNRWVHNSSSVIDAGNPYAVKLFNKFDKTVMTPFPNLSEEDISNVLAYVEYEANRKPAAAQAQEKPVSTKGGGQAGYLKTLLYILVGMLVIIALILMRVTSALNKLVHEKQGIPLPTPVPFYKNKKLITTLVLVFIIYIGYTTVNSAIDLGRQQGYGPIQPIKFSHQLHAGINGINCQYCHSTAAKSKHSNIPSVNVCMNCHRAIMQGHTDEKTGKKNTKYGRKEITKIYASIGYNPNTFKYIENYESMPRDSAEKIYTEWLKGDQDYEYSPKDVDEVLAFIQQPVKWNRIHNLPDHVYFNHSQHVTVGKLQCQQCHGPVQEMEVLYQYAPLSMGWCLSCHRSQEVQFNDSKYYEAAYMKYHEDMKAGKMDAVTVEKIGGTECQKCHY